MAWPITPDPQLLLYGKASPAQLSQALITAREALGPYYPSLDWPQWHQAFKTLEPTLKLEAGHVVVTPESLNELARHLETMLLPADTFSNDSSIQDTKVLLLGEASHKEVKKTYSIRVDVLESLNRVSFWRRKRKAALVNLALTQFLSQYPEAQIPIPNI